MKVNRIYTVLVPPLKNQAAQDLPGSELPLNGDLYELLYKAFSGASKECNIPIQFRADNQTNEMRTLLLDLLSRPSLARAIAPFKRLASISTRVFGLALCFVLLGEDDSKHIIYLARFPATEAIRTQLGQTFKVAIVKDIYMKSHRNYKAALFEDSLCH